MIDAGGHEWKSLHSAIVRYGAYSIHACQDTSINHWCWFNTVRTQIITHWGGMQSFLSYWLIMQLSGRTSAGNKLLFIKWSTSRSRIGGNGGTIPRFPGLALRIVKVSVSNYAQNISLHWSSSYLLKSKKPPYMRDSRWFPCDLVPAALRYVGFLIAPLLPFSHWAWTNSMSSFSNSSLIASLCMTSPSNRSILPSISVNVWGVKFGVAELVERRFLFGILILRVYCVVWSFARSALEMAGNCGKYGDKIDWGPIAQMSQSCHIRPRSRPLSP